MNSEELELSLRTEFESYLKGILADLRQEVSEFQKNFETEFEKHKAQTDEALRRLVERFETGVEFDQAFNESVIEHLRLARDEGATITAVAIGEAEKLREQAAPAAEYDKLRDAINEISSKTSQAEILKSLVDHAANFSPRGAFFIVKNEQFVGWRAFGDNAVDEATMRDIQFSMSSDTVMAEAVNTLGTAMAALGEHKDEGLYLDPLGYGTPDRMYAIPLVARGRGVAVLYADYGSEGTSLNPEALETLVRVAGLTVELAAAGVQPAPAPQHVAAPVPAETAEDTTPEPATEEATTAWAPATEAEPEMPAAETEAVTDEYEDLQSYAPVETEQPASFEEAHATFREEYEAPAETATEFEAPAEAVEEYQPPVEMAEEYHVPAENVEEYQAPAAFEETPVTYEPVEEEEPVVETVKDFSFGTQQETFARDEMPEPVQAVEEEQVPVERFSETIVEEVEEVTYFEPVEEQVVTEPAFAEAKPVEEYVAAEPVDEFPEVIEETAAEPVVEYTRPAEPVAEYVPQPQPEPVAARENGTFTPVVAAEPVTAEVAPSQTERPRYRDRNVDLPIEVPEDERRLHNDARRFARLLVSEIKLYNEQKVNDGRAAGDLYDRLREAIDRSREMYDKRVQQPVAEKFDYFHYELVNSLAEGNDVKLGASYPGSKVPA